MKCGHNLKKTSLEVKKQDSRMMFRTISIQCVTVRTNKYSSKNVIFAYSGCRKTVV